MNGRLIFQLSLFGLVMALATVFVIPSKIEPLFWLVIFVICAVIIARTVNEKYFLHGFLVSMLNSIWITTAHVVLFNQYIARHAEEAAMMANTPLAGSPRIMMLLTGPVIGAISGIVLGLFAVVASKLVKRS